MAVSSTSSGSLKTGVCLSTDRPDNPFTGQVIYETDTGKVYVWAGSTWVNIGDTSGEGVQLPSGTTAQRPASPTAGMIRFNETTGEPEWYSSALGLWVGFRNTPFLVTYLVIAGGGGGGGTPGTASAVDGGGGGGGAGGYLSNTVTLSPATNYTVTVGAGGAGSSSSSTGSTGVSSGISGGSLSAITAAGGGGGGGHTNNGANGGSGGGGGGTSASSGGTATAGQGNDGGDGGGNNFGGAGGGGAGVAGSNSTDGAGTDGGDGLVSTIITSAQATSLSVGEVIGSDVYYAGGAGGGSGQNGSDKGLGGSGGGGDGGTGISGIGVPPTAGTANTGGGGGGGGERYTSIKDGASGGSGVVIIRYPNSVTATVSAGLTSTTTTVGSDKVTVFTAGTGTVSWA